MRTPGLRLVSIDRTDKGVPRLRFTTNGRSDLREVVVYVRADKPVKFLYGYALWDKQSKTVVSYHGPYGDPERDTLGVLITDDL